MLRIGMAVQGCIPAYAIEFLIFLTFVLAIFVCYMKKLLAIHLLIIYLVAVTGVMIHLHFCGEELAAWGLYEEAQSCCDNACNDTTGEEQDGCCNNKVITAKISHEQQPANFLKLKGYAADWSFTNDTVYMAAYLLPVPAIQQKGIQHANAPPGLWEDIPLYKRFSRLVFYG